RRLHAARERRFARKLGRIDRGDVIGPVRGLQWRTVGGRELLALACLDALVRLGALRHAPMVRAGTVGGMRRWWLLAAVTILLSSAPRGALAGSCAQAATSQQAATSA